MKNIIKYTTNSLLILLMPFMMYITVSDKLINLSFADAIFVITAIIILLGIRKHIKEKKFIYILYFVGMVFSLILSQMMVKSHTELVQVPNVVTGLEIIKVLIVGGYFYTAYLFTKDSKTYKIASYSFSIGSILVALIGISAYVYFVKEKPFPVELFSIKANGRVVGTFEDPNLYAFYLIMIFYISLWNAKISKKKWVSFLMLFTSALSMILIILTMSRGGWLAFGCSLFIFGSLQIRHITKRRVLISGVFLLLLLGVVQADYTWQQGKTVQQVIQRIEQSLIQGEDVDRLELSEASIKMGNEYPLFGVGKGNFPLNSNRYLGEDNVNYISQYIPHSTILGTYAQQGIVGVVIFLSLPIFLLFVMLRSRMAQNGYMVPLLAGLFVQSFTINVENTRFLWYLLGFLLASAEAKIDIQIDQEKKRWSIGYGIALGMMIVAICVAYLNVGRYIYRGIIVYRGKSYERHMTVPTQGQYTLQMDIQTDKHEQSISIIDEQDQSTTYEFASAYGRVSIPIEVQKSITIRWDSHPEGWMRIRNTHLVGAGVQIPLYDYPLLPRGIEDWFNQNRWLVYADESSFRQPIEVVAKNPFEALQIEKAVVRKYSNLSNVFEFDMKNTEVISHNYQLDLRIDYESIGSLLANEYQRNVIGHYFTLWPLTSTWQPGETYITKANRFFSSTDFDLYGRFYDYENKIYPEERFFPIPFTVEKEEQQIRPFGESSWINIRYGKDDQNQIHIASNGWIETGRYDLDPGVYALSFRVKGNFLEEYGEVRIRDAKLSDIGSYRVDDETKTYTVQYTVAEKQEGMSFILELINYKAEKDVGDRRIFLEDWIEIKRIK